jgi:hypothetical protein
MERRTDSAYCLAWQTDYLDSCDHQYELELEDFPGSDYIAGLTEADSLDLPEHVVFWGIYPEFLDHVDYPTNNKYWPIMTRRMYYTLLAVGDFPHRVIPIALMFNTGSTFESNQRFLPSGQPNPEIADFETLVAIQILEKSNYFDFERSVYERHPRDPEWVRTVEKYVLNEPEEGFPPLFRLEVTPSQLFISSKAREALREAGIRGVAYYTLDDGYSLEEEVDIPVELPTYP